MKSVKLHLRRGMRLALMMVVVSIPGVALAVGTPSGTSVDNRAQVDYEVGTVAQLPIESSPTGNSTPGLTNGTDTSFLVDNLVDLTVAEVGGTATSVNPGQASAVTTFTVANTGNTTQDYALTPTNLVAGTVFGNTDNIDGNNLQVFVDSNGNGSYDAGVDTVTFIDSLLQDTAATVFIVVDIPIGAANGDAANVNLAAVTHDAGSGAASATAETAGVDTAGVDVVFGDTGRDGTEDDDDSYLVSAADLNIQKSSVVISDPFNLLVNPKVIPGALMEYSVTVTNTGTVAADNVRITDVLDGNVTLALGEYNGGAADVRIESGTGPTITFCTADNGDLDADGCGLTGATLEVDTGLTVGIVAADNPAVIRFRVTIN
jgi:uncharacterized repeat protein (TIGR01451 family)